MCNHELKYIVGVAGGVVCTNCGQHFDHIPTQAKPEAKPAEEKKAPAKKTVKKAPARKGAK